MLIHLGQEKLEHLKHRQKSLKSLLIYYKKDLKQVTLEIQDLEAELNYLEQSDKPFGV